MTSSGSGLVERILLVGFMASGKSAVGRVLAESLGWRFLDFDQEVERRAGRTIPDLFHQEGEGAFRRLEAAVARELLGRRKAVLAAGGGWPCKEGRMEGLDPATASVWLKVDAAEAVERAARDGDTRPLLRGADPRVRAIELLEARKGFYARAGLHVDTRDRSPSDIAREIQTRLARRLGGVPR